jgi:hypothetical protein
VEALNRLPLELGGDGFAPPDPGAEHPADFVVGIARVRDQIVVSVTAVRPGLWHALPRRAALTGLAGADGDQAATIAIRAVEVLRATILQASAPAAPVATSSTADEDPPDEAEASTVGWAVGVGTSMLQSFGGFGTAWGLAAHAAVRPREWLSLEIALAAPAWQTDLNAPYGSATIHQDALGAGVRYFFRASQRVRPSASLSAGLYHVSVDGHGAIGEATSAGLNALFAAAAMGVMLTGRGPLAVQAQAEILFAQPAPYVIVFGADAGHAGRPLVLLTLEIEWRSGVGSGAVQ